MNFSRIKTLAAAVTLSAAVMASAQFNTPSNARTDALAGAPLADITNVYNYPVLLLGYLNQAQVTWDADSAGGTGLGTVFLTKSFGDVFALGIVANQGHLLSNAGDNISAAFDLPSIPHVLIGFDFGAFKLGADLFCDLRSNNSNTTTGSNSTEAYDRTMHFGTRLSAGIEAGALGVLAKVGIGFPSLYESTTNTANNPSTVTTGTEKGLYAELGAEASYPVSIIDLTGGAEYVFADYQRALVSGAPAGTPLNPEYWHSLLRFYLSGEINVLETAAAVVQYEFSRIASTTTTTTSPASPPVIKSKTTAGNVSHNFYVGAENIWSDAWIFDSFALRSGFAYEITWDFNDTSNDNNNDKSHSGGPADHNYAKPIIGVGISKGPLTLDAALNFARLFENQDNNPNYDQWRGPLTSPTFASASATVKF